VEPEWPRAQLIETGERLEDDRPGGEQEQRPVVKNQKLTFVPDGSELFAELVRHLVASGVGVVGVEPERNELERIFLEVTRGDLQ